MKKQEDSEKERDSEIRMACIDAATRVVGRGDYAMVDNEIEKHQSDIVEVAARIYAFVMNK